MNWVKPHNEGITVSKEEFDFTSAKQGALVPADPTKTRITRGNYHTLINEALRQHIQQASTISRERQ